jgi:UrcA family protein
MKNLITLAAAATVATLNLSTGFANSVDERAVVVHYEDLDATQAKDAAVLYTRMKRAAEFVCAELEPGRLLGRMQPYAKCVQEALGRAVADLNEPAVTQYAARKVPASNTRIQIARGN